MPDYLKLYQSYLSAGTTFSRMVPPSGSQVLLYGKFDQSRDPLLPYVDTGLIYPGENGAIGDPSMLRYFNGVRFGGSGKLFIRAIIDNTVVCTGSVVLEEDAYQASIFRFPSDAAGYGVRLQMTGIAWWRYFEILWEPVASFADKDGQK